MAENKLFEKALAGLNNLSVYKNISNNTVVHCLYKCLQAGVGEINKAEFDTAANEFLCALIDEAERSSLSGNIYKKSLLKAFLYDENNFSLCCERGEAFENTSVFSLAKRDFETLENIINLPLNMFFDEEICLLLSNYVPVYFEDNYFYDNILKAESGFAASIARHYKTYGCGEMSRYGSFSYNSDTGRLEGIENPDKITFDDIIGYEYQKNKLIGNTEAFLAGYAANNVLLAGSRGTGKSSCVKACVHMFFTKGLRLIEITKEQILALPHILSIIRRRGLKFILFVDDLSFEDFEIEYKHMKSLLEGSSGVRPENVLFYATSNRRHIISEKWSDRVSGNEDAEIHTSDMMNEKMSLSDRFGLTLTFAKPKPDEYMKIVGSIAVKEGIILSENELNKRAMAWELNNKGMSGRSARQFVDALKWEIETQQKGSTL